MLPATPAPPATCNTPVVVLVLAVVFDNSKLPICALPNVPVTLPATSVALIKNCNDLVEFSKPMNANESAPL